jgi:hypothetical protein
VKEQQITEQIVQQINKSSKFFEILETQLALGDAFNNEMILDILMYLGPNDYYNTLIKNKVEDLSFFFPENNKIHCLVYLNYCNIFILLLTKVFYFITQDAKNAPESQSFLDKIDDSVVDYLLNIWDQINSNQIYQEDMDGQFVPKIEIKIMEILNFCFMNNQITSNQIKQKCKDKIIIKNNYINKR